MILVILAGVKPLEEAYRARNQSCGLRILAAHATLSPEQVEERLSIAPKQLRRFVVAVQTDGQEDRISLQLVRMSPEQIRGIAARLKGIEGVRSVELVSRGAGVSEEAN